MTRSDPRPLKHFYIGLDFNEVLLLISGGKKELATYPVLLKQRFPTVVSKLIDRYHEFYY
jgi:hypothetical protein